jgi:hypothetical protein
MGKFTAAFLAVVLAVIAVQVVLPMTAAKAVPASWIDKVVNDRVIGLQPSASILPVRQSAGAL